MLYAVCPTCGFLFADKEIEFEEKLSKICDKNENIIRNDETNDKITILLDDLNIKRYCCRMRIVTYINLVKIII